MKKRPDVTPVTVSIQALGGMGEGMGIHNGEAIYVPYSCAGDTLRVRLTQPKAQLLEILEPSADRVTPHCKHFTTCGGCNLQHLNTATYTEFKPRILQKILSQIGANETVIQPMIEGGQESRRRVEFKVTSHKGVVDIGFFEARTHALIAVEECPISAPQLLAPLSAFKQSIESLKKPSHIKAIHVTALDSGLDVIIHVSQPLNAKDREQLVQLATDQGFVRLSEQFEETLTLFDSGQALVEFAGVSVNFPTGAFLQATRRGEAAIAQLVTTHLQGCEYIADLYSGCGTYSFPLLAQAKRVSAYEGNDAMIAAMHNAILKAKLENKMSATARDLYKNPLTATELKHYDGIVINPSRNGALPQVKQIANSHLKKLVMVSCSPNSFKRDAKHLLDAGWRMIEATPIDQFYWSAHLEIVAIFTK